MVGVLSLIKKGLHLALQLAPMYGTGASEGMVCESTYRTQTAVIDNAQPKID